MHLKSFIGGIHPKDQKHYTKDLPIIKLNASDEVVFLLKQHIGAPCKPLVKIKDEVKDPLPMNEDDEDLEDDDMEDFEPDFDDNIEEEDFGGEE